MLDWSFFVFVGALSVAVLTPGPGIAALVATVLATGARRAIWLGAGIILGDLTWLALSLSGLALIAQRVPSVFVAIKWAGVAYLVYLAIKMWRTVPDERPAVPAANDKGIVPRLLAGFSLSMGNPKAMMFYLAILPGIVSPESLSVAMAAALALAVIGVLGAVFAVYMTAAEKARGLMTSRQSIRSVNRITAAALGGVAAWIAVRS